MLKYILYIIFFIIVIAILPKMFIINCGLNDGKFRLIKIKKWYSFLFNGIAFESSKKHGIIKQCLILQVVGYVLSLISIIIAVIWVTQLADYKNYLFTYFGVICLIESISSMIVIFILKKKAKKAEYYNKKIK